MSVVAEKQRHIQQILRQNSPFPPAETDRIIAKFFGSVPRLVRILVEQYQFDQKKVLDIGSSYGQSFFYWGEKSEAADVSDRMASLIKAQGRTVHILNIENEFPSELRGSFDAVFTNNLFEHLLSPHLFLARIHAVLRPGGILAIGHPLTPPFPFKQFWKLCGFDGWLEMEHVNFFTPQTAKLTLERGGFEVLAQHFSLFSRSSLLSRLSVPFGVHCLSVCKRIDGYSYAPIRHPMFDPTWAKDVEHFRQSTT